MHGTRTAELAARIASRAAGGRIDELLADGLGGNDLTTLLLHATATRARRRRFPELVAQAEKSRMLRGSGVDGRRLHAIDGAIFAAAERFAVLDLPPVVPSGSATCAGIDPNNVLATLRFAEVAADPAAGLALHAALAAADGTLRTCTSQRALRMQPLPPDQPHFHPHFRLAALCTAARAARRADDEQVDDELLLEQLVVWTDALGRLGALGFAVGGVRIVLSDTEVVRACLARTESPQRDVDDYASAVAALGVQRHLVSRAARLAERVGVPLRAQRPEVRVAFDLGRRQALGYYRGPYVQLHVRHTAGHELSVGDGGALPWLGAMRSDERRRLVVTGVGTEMLAKAC